MGKIVFIPHLPFHYVEESWKNSVSLIAYSLKAKEIFLPPIKVFLINFIISVKI